MDIIFGAISAEERQHNIDKQKGMLFRLTFWKDKMLIPCCVLIFIGQDSKDTIHERDMANSTSSQSEKA